MKKKNEEITTEKEQNPLKDIVAEQVGKQAAKLTMIAIKEIIKNKQNK